MFDASFGPYVLNGNKGSVARDGLLVAHLTHFETIILWCLAREPGTVVHRDEIFKVMYADRVPPSSNGIEVLIRRIRRKLDPIGDLNLIKTVRGKGYQLRNDWPQVTQEQAA